MGRPNIKEFYTERKPKENVVLPFGMSQIKRPCPLCRNNLFMLSGVVKCSSCNFSRKGRKDENKVLPMLQAQ